ncbi:MAG TPA: hypothetical protein VFT64_12285 [Rickettsiales bacterium]|nr:hypothetical protein [Rickettsiales bacterium]
MKKEQVVFFTGFPEAANEGVGDYTRNQARELETLGYEVLVLDNAQWDLTSENSLQKQLDALNPDHKQQIIHVQYPGLGERDRQLLDQIESLDLQASQKLVFTFHQFSLMKGGINPGTVEYPGFCMSYKNDTLPVLRKADQIVFTTDAEQQSAVEFAGAHGIDLRQKSSVIPVPSNIPLPACVPERSSHIGSFARFRAHRRGLEQLIEMAEDIRGRTLPPDAPQRQASRSEYEPGLAAYDERQQNHTIHLIGDIVETRGDEQDRGLKFVKNDIVRKIYNLTPAQLDALERIDNKQDLVKFLQGKSKRLNVELHLGESAERVGELISEMGYMVTLVKGGVTGKNGSVIPGMQMGRVTLATEGEDTPAYYRNGSIVLVEDWGDALRQINHMEREGTSIRTEKNPHALTRDEIGGRAEAATANFIPRNVAIQHEQLYESLFAKAQAIDTEIAAQAVRGRGR